MGVVIIYVYDGLFLAFDRIAEKQTCKDGYAGTYCHTATYYYVLYSFVHDSIPEMRMQKYRILHTLQKKGRYNFPNMKKRVTFALGSPIWLSW